MHFSIIRHCTDLGNSHQSTLQQHLKTTQLNTRHKHTTFKSQILTVHHTHGVFTEVRSHVFWAVTLHSRVLVAK